MSAILVTGAAGFAGGHLLDLLSGGGREIVAWHRPGGRRPREVAGTTWAAIDLLDRAEVATAIARLRPSTVYHCAGAAHVGRGWDDTESTFAVNVRGTHHLLDALQRAGVTARVLVPSSALVYASAAEPLRESHPLVPNSPYGVSKLAQEMLAQRTNGTVSVALARPFNHVGPRQDPHFAASGFARRIADIERGGMTQGVAASGGAAERVAVAHVAVDEPAGQPAGGRGPREDHDLMAARRERANDGAPEVSGAARDQHRHCGSPRQNASRSSSVCSMGIIGVQPSSSRSRPGSPTSSGVSFGR